MNVHSTIPCSRANGPGVNTVLWFQGCTHKCKGCSNPDTWDASLQVRLATPYELLKEVHPEATGITLTGGEPLQQSLVEVLLLVTGARNRGLNVTLFSGYTVEEINASPIKTEIVNNCTTAVLGRFRKDLPCTEPLKGSANQVVIGNTEGVADAEIHLDLDTGLMVITGVHR